MTAIEKIINTAVGAQNKLKEKALAEKVPCEKCELLSEAVINWENLYKNVCAKLKLAEDTLND